VLDSDSPVYFSSVAIVEIAIESAWGLLAGLDFVPQLNGLGYQELPLVAVDAEDLGGAARYIHLDVNSYADG